MSVFATGFMRASGYGAIGGSGASRWPLRDSITSPAFARSLNGAALIDQLLNIASDIVSYGVLGLKGVLKSGGLLAGSAFTLDIEGVWNCPTFRFVEFTLLVEPGRGVLGASPSILNSMSV